MVSEANDGAGVPARLGAWVRTGPVVGMVAGREGDDVTVFDPGGRRRQDAPAGTYAPVPAAAVRVTVTVDLPLAHGLDEADLRRWVAMLVDPVLRERAAEALRDAGLDDGVTLPRAEIAAGVLRDGLGRCLCGATTPARPDVTPPPCEVCGRQPAPPAEA
jgi:hypothetical protein